MNKQGQVSVNISRLKFVVLLAALLMLSAAVFVPLRAAAQEEATVLELYQGKPDANERFEARNMLPGDTVTKYFCIKASHDADIDLFFRTSITGQTKALGDVLHVKVTRLDTDEVLCDAPFAELDGQEFSELLKADGSGETIANYRIDVSLDTSVDNAYQAAALTADFEWYVKDEGGLTPPQTGDTANTVLWAVLGGSVLLLALLIFLMMRRRKEGGQHA